MLQQRHQSGQDGISYAPFFTKINYTRRSRQSRRKRKKNGFSNALEARTEKVFKRNSRKRNCCVRIQFPENGLIRLRYSVDVEMKSDAIASGRPSYSCPMYRRKANAPNSRLEPNRSPSAVRYGIDDVSGSILNRHIAWIMTCAIKRSNITCWKINHYRFVLSSSLTTHLNYANSHIR